jgi:8-oxo-dGTP pyrophosphatase MutT (NUDIX family)
MSDIAAHRAARADTDFFARAQARLSLDVPAGLADPDVIPRRGDHDLDPVVSAIAAVRPIKPAAVLIPVIEREEPMVLLTQRAIHLPDHAGQIAFPGGKIDRGDPTPLAASLREAHEEIGHRIVPTLARVQPGFSLALNRAEVDDVFEVPLSFLMEAANHQRHSREWQGMTRTYYAIPFGERYIWGVTAGILRNLYERIYQE